MKYWAVKEGEIGYRIYNEGFAIADFASGEMADEYVNFKQEQAQMKAIIESKINPVDESYVRDCNLADERSNFNRRGA